MLHHAGESLREAAPASNSSPFARQSLPMPHAAAPPLPLAATMAAAASLPGTISVAGALVLAGREVDLSGPGQEAQRLCAAASCLPREDGARLRLALVDLTSEIDRFVAALRA